MLTLPLKYIPNPTLSGHLPHHLKYNRLLRLFSAGLCSYSWPLACSSEVIYINSLFPSRCTSFISTGRSELVIVEYERHHLACPSLSHLLTHHSLPSSFSSSHTSPCALPGVAQAPSCPFGLCTCCFLCLRHPPVLHRACSLTSSALYSYYGRFSPSTPSLQSF